MTKDECEQIVLEHGAERLADMLVEATALNATLAAALQTLASLYDDDTLREFVAYCDGPMRAAVGPRSKDALDAALSAARAALAAADNLPSPDGSEAVES